MSNTTSSPTTAIRGSSSDANASTAADTTAATAGAMTMSNTRTPCQPTTTAVIYPVASSGRGFFPTNHPCRPIIPYHPHPFNNHRPPPPPTPLSYPSLKGPTSLHPKVTSSPFSLYETKGYKSVRERTKDDSLVSVRDRKVRITDEGSIYALCRSWLRNGFSDETRPQYGDIFKSLPQPLPIPVKYDLPKETEVREEQVQDDKKEATTRAFKTNCEVQDKAWTSATSPCRTVPKRCCCCFCGCGKLMRKISIRRNLWHIGGRLNS